MSDLRREVLPIPDAEHIGVMQRLFEIEAAKYKVLPLDPRFAERFNAEMAGRPNPVAGRHQLLFGGMHRLQENVVINIKNKSHAVTAELEVPAGGAAGVIIAQGGNMGGWALYAHDGCLRYAYNFTGARLYTVGSETPLPAGTHQVRMEFAYDGGGIGKGGDVTLYLDGEQVGAGRVETDIDDAAEDLDHLISPQERFRLAMAKQ